MQDDFNDPWSGGGETPTGAPSGGPTFEQVNADYQKWLGRPLTQDEYEQYWKNAQGYNESFVANSAEGLARTNQNVPGTGSYEPGVPIAPGNETGQNAPTPVPVPAPGPSDGPGPGIQTSKPTVKDVGVTTNKPPIDLTKPFDEPFVPFKPEPLPTPQALPTMDQSFASIPGAPAFPTIPRFSAPSMEEAMADPGYKFVLDQGNQNLQNWAAARGTLNDSSTGKAMIDYGQGAATTQYGNVWDRAYRTYDTNTQTQYLAPWQAAYQNWMGGTVGPTLAQYGQQASNATHQNDQAADTVQQNNAHAWQDNWNKWFTDSTNFRDWRNFLFDSQYKVATA